MSEDIKKKTKKQKLREDLIYYFKKTSSNFKSETEVEKNRACCFLSVSVGQRTQENMGIADSFLFFFLG